MPKHQNKGTYQKQLQKKKDKCDWSNYHFLENLLIFRVLDNHDVPAESGVKFRISREDNTSGLCLLIWIDHPTDPVFDEGQVRPDYLVLYMSGTGCICTIVEMKGKSSENLKHGLEQIKALAEKLKEEFRNRLPGNFKMYIQGILLAPHNAQLPLPLIADMARRGLTILPVKYASKAELFPYISKKNEHDERFENQVIRRPAPLSPLDHILARCAFQKRIRDKHTLNSTLHIDYVLSEYDDHMSLFFQNRNLVFSINERGTTYFDMISEAILNCGLEDKFRVERIARETEDEPQPIAEPLPHKEEGLRPYGLSSGAFRVPDDFDAPLPDAILDPFEGR